MPHTAGELPLTATAGESSYDLQTTAKEVPSNDFQTSEIGANKPSPPHVTTNEIRISVADLKAYVEDWNIESQLRQHYLTPAPFVSERPNPNVIPTCA